MLTVTRLRKEFVSKSMQATLAIADVSLQVREGEFVSIVGPSGCGKTTLLMNLAGLMDPTSGEIVINGQPVREPPAGVILVFQEYNRSLLPWRSVLKNILYGLELRRQAGRVRDAAEQARKYLEVVGLTGFERHFPWQLSGGMQQRVAIARALACEPRVLLMDEPFGSLDAQTRADLEDVLINLWREFRQTILFVTHDIDEAIYLSDRVFVLSSRPSTILGEIVIDLERPRQQLATKADRRFIDYRARIHHLITADASDAP